MRHELKLVLVGGLAHALLLMSKALNAMVMNWQALGDGAGDDVVPKRVTCSSSSGGTGTTRPSSSFPPRL